MQTRLVVLAILVPLAVVVPACEGGAPPRTGADPAGAAEAPRRGVVPIAFEARKAGSKALPLAFVEGKIGNRPTRFVLDTGAGVHVLDSAVATETKIGGSLAPRASLVSIDGWGTLPEHPLAVRELSANLRAHGIGGIIAPQLLADSPTEAVVVDFVNRQLRARPQSTAWSEMEDLGVVLTPPGPRRFCPVDSGGVAGVVLALDGTVEGEATRLELDTGASHTMLFETSAPAARAAAHPVLGRSVVAGDGADVAVSIHGGVPITIGGFATTLDVGVTPSVRHAECGYQGRLGIDVLQHCALAMTSQRLLVGCRAPGGGAAPAH